MALSLLTVVSRRATAKLNAAICTLCRQRMPSCLSTPFRAGASRNC